MLPIPGGIVKKNSIILATLAGFVGLAPAYAQDTSSDSDEGVVEEIRVTGSRIVRKDYASSSPVVTIDNEDVNSFGAVTVEETLNNMPQFIAGSSSSTIAIGGGGGATLNLRALSPTRTLVLMDQRRMPSSTPFGEVDVNIIPGVILEGVEVLTGGASSVYGSEAIAGVVNFQTARYFDGIRYGIEYGESSEGDGAKTDLSVAFSTTGDGGRGRVMVALSRSDRDAIRGIDRDWRLFSGPSSFLGTGTYRAPTNPVDLAALDALFASYGVPCTINQADRIGFNDNGSLFIHGINNPSQCNYQGPTSDDSLYWISTDDGSVRMPVGGRQGDILKPLERDSAFAKGEYDLTDRITAYGQFLYSDAETISTASRNLSLFGPTITVPVTNPFTPPDLAALLATRADPTADWILNKRFIALPNRSHVEDFVTTQFVVGFKGDVGYKDWTYDVYVTSDSVDATETIDSHVLGSRVNDLVQAADGGASICSGGYNFFGNANELSLSDECKRYISPGTSSTFKSSRSLWEGTVTGSLFEIPSGDVQFSFTAGYREDELKTTVDTAIQSDDALGLGPRLPSFGETDTTEFGGELLVPIVDSLDLTAGFRTSDQNVTGSAESWNIGLEWRPTDTVFARASLQQAVRAPNVGELFNSPVAGEVTVGDPVLDPGQGDPCDVRTNFRIDGGTGVRQICLDQGIPAGLVDSFTHDTVSLPALVGGNTALEAEEADTLTLGVVWQPDLGDHDLNVTLDYWQIEVDGVINPINGNEVLNRCYSGTFNPSFDSNNTFCQLISRDSATGTVTAIRTTFLNLARLETSGIDLQVSHAVDMGPGTLSTTAYFGFLNKFDQQNLPGESFQDLAGTVGGTANRGANDNFHPELKFTLQPTYSWGNASVSLRWRYLSSLDDISTAIDPSSTVPGIGSQNYFDLSGTYDLSDSYALSLSINNLANDDPPEFGGRGNTRWGSYDVVGTFFTIGLTGSFE